MSDANRDANRVPSLLGISSTDPEATVPVAVDPATNRLLVNATILAGTIATSTNQTDGSQKTQIVDAGGEVATVTGGKLDVNATTLLSGEPVPISGATTAVGVAIVDSSGNQVSSFGTATSAKQDTLLTELQLKANLTEEQPVYDEGNNETLILLRRMVKLLESQAVVDYAGRQRMVLDSLPGAAITTTIPVSGTVTASVSTITANGGVDPRYEFMELAHISYATNIRSNLAFI